MSRPKLQLLPVCGCRVPLPPVSNSPVTLFNEHVVEPGGQPGIPIADGETGRRDRRRTTGQALTGDAAKPRLAGQPELVGAAARQRGRDERLRVVGAQHHGFDDSPVQRDLRIASSIADVAVVVVARRQIDREAVQRRDVLLGADERQIELRISRLHVASVRNEELRRTRRSRTGVVRPDDVLLELVVDELAADGELRFTAPHGEQVAVELEVGVLDRLIADLDLPGVRERGEHGRRSSAAERVERVGRSQRRIEHDRRRAGNRRRRGAAAAVGRAVDRKVEARAAELAEILLPRLVETDEEAGVERPGIGELRSRRRNARRPSRRRS